MTVSPENVSGTLQLQIKSSANIQDLSGNALVTTPLIADSEVIIVRLNIGLTLKIRPNDSVFDFSWFSRPDKYYDLLSRTNLATLSSTWSVYNYGETL